jgi:putative sterol carrier protein
VDIQDKQAILARLQEAFQPERAAGVNAAVQLNLSGEGAGTYYVKIADQALTGGEGAAENPRLTITANTRDLVGIFEGRVDAMSAYFQGRVQVQGDMGFAMQMVGLFKRPRK